MALGSNTDCYQPVERHQNITRGLLAVFQRFGHPVVIITKSDLITRDLDILADLAARRLVAVNISVTTLDRELARRLEPRAPTPAKRLAALAALAAADVPVNLLMAPIIPGLTDHEIERVVAAGASSAGYILLLLPRELQWLFAAWLECHTPARADRVLNLIRDAPGGALYRSDWGRRMRGDGPVADLIAQRFHNARARHGLVARRYDLALDQFAIPADDGRQMSLFQTLGGGAGWPGKPPVSTLSAPPAPSAAGWLSVLTRLVAGPGPAQWWRLPPGSTWRACRPIWPPVCAIPRL